MVWIPGTAAGTPPPLDLNAKFKAELKGELDEDVARSTLGGFLKHNIGVLTWIMTGDILEPYQRIMIKGWLQKNFSLCVAGRGFGKSRIFAHFCWLYCLFNSDRHILITSATFRSSRRIIEQIDAWSKRQRNGEVPGGQLLRETFAGDRIKRQDMERIIFKNGSSVTAVPLGDPDNLRGFRCNVLGIDERVLISNNTVEMVLKPFLMGGTDVTKKQLTRRKEKRMIKEGRMKEEERKKWKSQAKMIELTSASYKWEELYTNYKQYLDIICPKQEEDPNAPKAEEIEDGSKATYLVQQLSYEVASAETMEPAILDQIKNKMIPQGTIDREYRAIFTDESGGYFSAKEMNECTIPQGSEPCIEIVGDRTAEYILGIDPNISSSAAADHFAMCVVKLIKRPADGKKIALVVHQYGCAGAELKHHIAYFYYLLHAFRPVYVICDTTQGDQGDFISVANESEYFKSRGIQLGSIDANFTNTSVEETVKEVRRSYNADPTVARIVQKQSFTSDIIKAGNEYMRACFDQRTLLFASDAQSVPNKVTVMCSYDILDIHKFHPEYHEEGLGGSASMWEFVTYQDTMTKRVKKECAMIEATPTPMGILMFNLPHGMTKDRKNQFRQRKDNYSALWLANWAAKIYVAMTTLPPQEQDEEFVPVMIGGRQ